VDAHIRTGYFGGHRGRGFDRNCHFDAKVALPAKGKSKHIAVDVAAMSNDDGTVL